MGICYLVIPFKQEIVLNSLDVLAQLIHWFQKIRSTPIKAKMILNVQVP